MEILKTLGVPTLVDRERLIYSHEHGANIEGEPFTTFNVVVVRFQFRKNLGSSSIQDYVVMMAVFEIRASSARIRFL